MDIGQAQMRQRRLRHQPGQGVETRYGLAVLARQQLQTPQAVRQSAVCGKCRHRSLGRVQCGADSARPPQLIDQHLSGYRVVRVAFDGLGQPLDGLVQPIGTACTEFSQGQHGARVLRLATQQRLETLARDRRPRVGHVQYGQACQ